MRIVLTRDSSMFWHIIFATSLLKLLAGVRPTESHDFNVHRHWLALTNTLPVDQWYTDPSTGYYSLDYMPLFAWCEWALSQFAPLFDSEMLKMENTKYFSKATSIFQTTSVVLLDLSMVFGIWICSRALELNEKSKNRLAVFLFTNAGQYCLDYINFHYSGITVGILLASLGYMLMGKCFKSAALFVLAINLNQSYLFFSPAYFIYLLSSYCDPLKKSPKACLYNFSCLALIVITGFATAFAPFVWFGQLTQVLQRVFPFDRGLIHPPFFAPNIWTLYTLIDLFLGMMLKHFNLSNVTPVNPNLTEDKQAVFAVLPKITPMITNIITMAMLVPVLVKLWKSANQPEKFLRGVILCSFTCFLFGW